MVSCIAPFQFCDLQSWNTASINKMVTGCEYGLFLCAIAQVAGYTWKFRTIHPFSKRNHRTNMVGHMKNQKTIYESTFKTQNRNQPTNKQKII